jgi:microcin C transport system substrate-binding protein
VSPFVAAILAVAAWQPGPDWKETPDPVASPLARKGGVVRFNGASAPKSLNGYVDNNSYTAMMFSLMYDKLLSTDTETLEFEPGLARRWLVSEDGREFTFEIDERAKWSDGVPVSARDVKWTFDAVTDPKSETGSWKILLGEFDSPEILDPDEKRPRLVRFRKKDGFERNWRDLINCSTFWVMPSHAFAGRDFNKLDLVGAVVGGPYRISRMDEQVETEYSRVREWWRADTPACRHTCNFDRILMRYYADNENAFDALKKGAIDVYPLYLARLWATETSGTRFERNWLVKRRVRNHEPVGFQGFAMNMRRWPFDDLRVRKAMAKLIDREKMNSTMMYGAYFLQRSYFEDLYDAEHPCGNPLYLFDPDGAKALLAEAGFVRNPSTGILEKDGRPLEFTFLSRSATDDRFLVHFNAALKDVGVKMSIVRKDFAGWMRDMDSFEFDMTWQSWGAAVFRNPETMWLSSEADRRQSGNTVGFKSAEVDRLIKDEKTMATFAEREAAYREIDRLVAAECPYAFLWNIAAKRLVYWNKFGMPDAVLSKYDNEAGVLAYWWYDPDKAEELAEAKSRGTFLPSVPVEVDYDSVMKGRE